MLINNLFFIYGQNITRVFQKAMERSDGITVLTMPNHMKNNIEIMYDSNHKIVNDYKSAIETSYQYNAIPVLFFPDKFNNKIKNNKFTDIIQLLTMDKTLYVEPMFRGVIYIPLNNQQDIKDSSKVVEIIQKRDYPIGDLKEIGFRRGL